jgi:hypothetical protein
MELLLGTFIGFGIAFMSMFPLEARVLRRVSEEELIRELKRRRFEEALKYQIDQMVELEVNGPPPAPKKE